MNTFQESSHVHFPAPAMVAEKSGMVSLTRPHSPPSVSSNDTNEPTVADFRIDSLSILAQALLHEIEGLKGQSGTSRSTQLNLQAEVRRFEAEIIKSALIKTGGRQRRAARLLGMKVTTLNTKIKRYKIKPEELAMAVVGSKQKAEAGGRRQEAAI
jgi:DNA-binding NtrC family response regulator